MDSEALHSRTNMQTHNFNCSHCGKLMAVGLNLLGRNVRCPHCKQVVQAPASVGPPIAPTTNQGPSFNLPGPVQESHESIFGEVHDDDVFGTRQPKVQLPAEAKAPAPVPAPGNITVSDVGPTVQVQATSPQYAAANAPTVDLVPQTEFPVANPWA